MKLIKGAYTPLFFNMKIKGQKPAYQRRNHDGISETEEKCRIFCQVWKQIGVTDGR